MSSGDERDDARRAADAARIEIRLRELARDLHPIHCDVGLVARKVALGLVDGIASRDLDALTAETAASLACLHPDYSLLAGRVAATRLWRETSSSFAETTRRLFEHVDAKTGRSAPLVSAAYARAVEADADRLDAAIVHERDLDYDLFGFATLEKSYLLKIGERAVERPQYVFMRVAVAIHPDDVEAALETYDATSRRLFTHASPTLFNAGTPNAQLASCFLLATSDDSIDGIYETLTRCAKISRSGGGIGVSIHDVRARGSYIRSSNGESNGIVPMLRVFDATARYVNQGGKRKGSIAVFIEPWHADVDAFLDLKKNHGKEEHRARDLFYGLWIPDLFMRRVEANATWTLFCPNEARGLADVYGSAFDELYERYEREGRGRATIRAQDLWAKILVAQIETGTPYVMFKDACNEKNNQKNLGALRGSNLCTEILQYTAPDEIAVCTLASVNLAAFVDRVAGTFDRAGLLRVVRIATRNLNRIVDVNAYPLPEAERGNLRHRPVGIGVQGLADAFADLRLAFESPAARALNRDVFETIYFGALSASVELAERDGPYETFAGSPASLGKLQFDMWNEAPNEALGHDWAGLRARLARFGARNSLLVAPMPTASTSQILGNNECFEPYTSNLYSRRVSAGDFVVANRRLVRDLDELGLWTPDVRDRLVAERGSVSGIAEIPADVRERYKTVWEIKQRSVVDMAADRAPFVDQSQSLNIHLADPTIAKLTSVHFHSWRRGLKTGMYYLRTRPRSDAIQFTVEPKAIGSAIRATSVASSSSASSAVSAASAEDGVDCVACGS